MNPNFRYLLIVGIVLATITSATPATNWKIKPATVNSQWAKEVTVDKVHPEYPRPQMVREEWKSLNGLWDYEITDRDQTNAVRFNKNILVPFPIESSLSKVGLSFNARQRLWYKRKFHIPENWSGRSVLLHFEAVDWETQVWVNAKLQGSHCGAYDRFTFDITEALKPQGEQEIVVAVYDPTEYGTQPRGNQRCMSQTACHTACSGIWGSVWIEPVAQFSIGAVKLTSDVDAQVINVTTTIRGTPDPLTVDIAVMDGGSRVSHINSIGGQTVALKVPQAKIWSPLNPFLYDLKLTLIQNGRAVDTVTSYCGMRKVGLWADSSGKLKFTLNKKETFLWGIIDQGCWPEGIYTAPTDEAIRSDIEAMRSLGFNVCRKHMKVEPERWYYWCDKLGMMVCQDMPGGDRVANASDGEIRRTSQSADEFESELTRMVESLGNHPCIVAWVPFSNQYGQYEAPRINTWLKSVDSSRLVVSTGGNDLATGDIWLVRNPAGPTAGVRAVMIDYCGGITAAMIGHVWQPNMASRRSQTRFSAEITEEYKKLASKLRIMAKRGGIAGAFCLQFTDVEDEYNGLLSYDRVLKIDRSAFADISKSLTLP